MHELGIVFHTIKTVERVGADNGLTEIASVTLELGEVSGAIPKELVSCWDWAVQRSDLLRGAALHIETLPAVTHCGGCGQDTPPWPMAARVPAAAARTHGCCGAARSVSRR